MATKKPDAVANDKLAPAFLNQKLVAKPPKAPPKKTAVDKAADRGAIRESAYADGGKVDAAKNDKLAPGFLNSFKPHKPKAPAKSDERLTISNAPSKFKEIMDKRTQALNDLKCGGKVKPKKFARGGGVESKGKTRGRFI